MLLIIGKAWQGLSLNAKRCRTLLFHLAWKLIEEHAEARLGAQSGAAKARPEAIAEIVMSPHTGAEIETQQMKRSWMTNATGSHHRLVGWPP